MSGDFRAPFLTWLAEFCPEYWQKSGDSKALMPPIPPNLNRFSYALKSFSEQLGINPDCLAAACGLSADAKEKLLPVSSILDGLSTKEMKALLARVAEGDGARVMAELNRLRSPMVDQECQRMSCMKFADLVFDVRKRRTEEEEGKEAEERERKAIEYRHHLETIFKDNVSIWESLDPLMDNKIASAYDKAAGRLKVLRDAYGLFSKDAAFQNRLAAFRDRYSRRPAMMRRIEDL